MSRRNLIFASLAGFLAASFLFVGLASAHSFRTGDNVTLGQGEVVNDTLFISGRTIDINSEVNGDIFCAGQTINITGKVHGDVICAGQTIHVTGVVDGDVRLAGQTVNIGATVIGNASIGTQSFNLESGGKIAGDVTIGAQDASFNGVVGRDIAAGSANITIANLVGRNIKATVENIRLGSNAKVVGTIDYTSVNDIQRDAGSKVGGPVTRSDPPKKGESKKGAIFGFSLGWFIYLLLAMVVVSMALVLLIPGMFQRFSDRALPRPWKALLTGFLAGIGVQVLIVILLVTIIGIPLGLTLALAWLLILTLSGPVTAYYIGRLVLRNSNNALLFMLVGSAILLVLYFIPIVGLVAFVFAIWAGSGMVLMEVYSNYSHPKYSFEYAPKRAKPESKPKTQGRPKITV